MDLKRQRQQCIVNRSNKRFSFGSVFFVTAILVTQTLTGKTSESHELPCKSIGNKPGLCITLKNCPVFFNSLTSGTATLDVFRTLQKFTCGFERSEPRVCCPIENVSKSAESRPDSDGLVDFEKGRYSISKSFESHINYNLLPKLNACGRVNISTVLSDRIIGGTSPPLGSQPWLARIGYKSDEKGGVSFYCGGSLISKRYVLTAAHCSVSEENNLPIMVRLSEHDLSTDPDCSEETGKCSYKQDVKVEKVIPHPQYNQDTKQHDIALLRLAEDVNCNGEFIHPLCLPISSEKTAGVISLGKSTESKEQESKDISLSYVAGFGTTTWDVVGESRLLQYVNVPIVSNEKCQDIYFRRTVISETQLCAGGIRDRDSCDGDSGGPLVVYSTRVGGYLQAGIVSYGPTRCGSAGLPGIYTRVSEYIGWILDNVEPS